MAEREQEENKNKVQYASLRCGDALPCHDGGAWQGDHEHDNKRMHYEMLNVGVCD